MNDKVYTFQLIPDWSLISLLNKIERFEGSWSFIEKRESQSLKEFKWIAAVQSAGASTRIEGARITDDEVEVLIRKADVPGLKEQDDQEVAGYFETSETISGSFADIDISENQIMQLHKILMKYSEKDAWHRGGYKQHSNVVEVTQSDGSRYVVFRTSNPGIETEDAMRNLIRWYHADKETHPLIKIAAFVYDFLSIHPFQDGNGRMSRLLTSLLLLKNGYSWIQYISFEHEIEKRKKTYYRLLMQCQKQRPGEDILPWIMFFLDCLDCIQGQLMSKLESGGVTAGMSIREKKIYNFIQNYPGSKSGEIAGRLQIPLPTIKRMLAEMTKRDLITKQGIGAGTNYSII